MAEFDISTEDLRRLARLVEENGLSELRYEDGDLRVTLRTAAHRPPSAPTIVTAAAPASPGDESDDVVPADDMPPPPFTAAPAGRVIEAPVMGVFYRSPAPGEPPFVDVGDTVESGQPVGMIEAMKVFSEVLCEVTGRVIDIPAKNGALVQPGERLVVVEEQA